MGGQCKMLSKLSAQPLSLTHQEEALCCPCTHGSMLEQNMFFCQTHPPFLLIHFKNNGSSTVRPHLAQILPIQLTNILHHCF